MKLDQLVETTFLPPAVNRRGISNECFEYNLKEETGTDREDNVFVPYFRSKSHNIDYKIQKNGEKAYNCGGYKAFFTQRSDAIKLCWEYFRYNLESFIPQVEKEVKDAT